MAVARCRLAISTGMPATTGNAQHSQPSTPDSIRSARAERVVVDELQAGAAEGAAQHLERVDVHRKQYPSSVDAGPDAQEIEESLAGPQA